MRISLSTLKLNNNTYCSNTNTVANQPCCEKEARNNGVSVPLHSLQANCALSFGAAAIHDNTKTFYDAYEPVLPKKFRDALKDYNDNLHLNPLNQKSLFDINYDTYKKLADCHTVDDIKAAYPDEPLFQELRPAYEVELPKQKCHLKTFLVTYCDYFAASDRANGQPVFSASNDDDLTVYLVKKAFLEGKSQTEIQKDFANDLNQSLAEKLPAFEDIPRTLYDKLGILYFKPVDFGAYSALSKEDKEKLNMHSVRYRSSFVSSRQDFNRKHTNVYVKAKKDKIIEKLIDKILTDTPGRTFVRSEKESLIDDIFGTKETGMNPAKTGINGKSQYILYLAWNNSPELRKDWAEFLNRKEAEGCVSVEDYNPNLVNMSAALKNRMTEFFGETPSRKVDLTATCSDAYDIVSNAVENDVYEELKGAILEERNKIIEDFKTKKAEADKLAEAARLAAEKERLERLEQEKAEKAKADILAQEKLKAEEIAKLERAAKEEAAAAKEAEINAEIAIMRPSFIIAPEKAMREIAETRLAFRMLEAEKTRIKEAVRALPGVIFIGDVAMIEYNEAYGESYVALTSMQKGVEVINQKIENLVMKQQKNHENIYKAQFAYFKNTFAEEVFRKQPLDKKNFISFLEQDDARGNYGLINYLLAHIHNVCTIKTTPTKANGETCSLYRNKYMEDLANKTEKLLDRRELVDAYTRRDIDLQIDGAIQVQSVIAKCCEYVNQNYKGKSLSRVYTHIEREYNKIINEQRGAAERAHVKNKRHK